MHFHMACIKLIRKVFFFYCTVLCAGTQQSLYNNDSAADDSLHINSLWGITVDSSSSQWGTKAQAGDRQASGIKKKNSPNMQEGVEFL